jgi:hypothetical protein
MLHSLFEELDQNGFSIYEGFSYAFQYCDFCQDGLGKTLCVLCLGALPPAPS